MIAREKVCVIGLGYIGFPTACLIAASDFRVLGVDIQSEKIEKISAGLSPFKEPELDELFGEVFAKNNIEFSTQLASADIFVLCVPTPITGIGEHQQADMKYINSTVDALAEVLQPGNMVIVESTCPVGTTKKIATRLTDLLTFADQVDYVYCPERVLPGRIVYELKNNDRVIGGMTQRATSRATKFYSRIVSGNLHTCTAEEAELCKLAENSFRDVNIAFSNALSMYAAEKQTDIFKVIELANFHPRVNILSPGIGVGGHCIPVDPWFIISDFTQKDSLFLAARKTNKEKTKHVINDIETRLDDINRQIKPRLNKLIFYGSTYKENCDDTRNSPANEIIDYFKNSRYEVRCVDPHVRDDADNLLRNISSLQQKSSVHVFLVKHDEFVPYIHQLQETTPHIIDCCGLKQK